MLSPTSLRDRTVGLSSYLMAQCPPHWLLRRSEEHTSELQSQSNLVCRLLLEKKNRRRICPASIAPWPARPGSFRRSRPGLLAETGFGRPAHAGPARCPVSHFPRSHRSLSVSLTLDSRERHQPHAQTDEHRPRPAMHGDRFLQDELGRKGANDVDQRGCRKHNTEVSPGQDRKKPDEMHDHEHNAGEKVVIANGPTGDRQKRSRRKGGHFAHLPHAFGEQDISYRIGEHNDRNQDCRFHLPPSAMVSWPPAIPTVLA